MEKDKKNLEDIEDRLAEVGEFIKEEPEEVKKEKDIKDKEHKIDKEEEQPQEKQEIPKLDPDKFKEVIVEIVSYGLKGKEKDEFITKFQFFNHILFSILNLDQNLDDTLGKLKVNLTPGKSVLLYMVGVAVIAFALRKGFGDKDSKRTKSKPDQKRTKKDKNKLNIL